MSCGHTFVIRGDLTRLACDAWLIPSDEYHNVETYWTADEYGPDDYGKAERLTSDRRAVPLPERGGPRPWLGFVGLNRSDVGWFVGSAVAFLGAAATELERTAARPLNRRERFLLALPVVGTGKGSGGHEAGVVLRELLPALHRWVAQRTRFDVALVCFNPDTYAAAQAARADLVAHSAPTFWTAQLPAELVREADRLAGHAKAGNLALFLGAGVSVAAGLPTWGGLLEQLAAALPERTDEERGKLQLLSNPLDQASVLQRWLGERPIGAAVLGVLGRFRHYALGHALLAALPVREVVTTNYDQLFDSAWGGTCAPDDLAVLPDRPRSGARRLLLKMHGCLSRPERIVLTRESYIRYDAGLPALIGLVQAFLLTRHMLFVGFSLTDDNFHRLVDGVRLLRGSGERDKFGTALALGQGGLVADLWSDDVERVVMIDRDEARAPGASQSDFPTAEAARRLEVVLDYIAAHTRSSAHLFVSRFEGALTPGEERLRDALDALITTVCADPAVHPTDAWQQVRELLLRLGYAEAGLPGGRPAT